MLPHPLRVLEILRQHVSLKSTACACTDQLFWNDSFVQIQIPRNANLMNCSKFLNINIV